MIRTRLARFLASASLLLGTCTAAHATLISYTSDSAFAAATSGGVTDTYNDLTSSSFPSSPLTRSLGGGSYSVNSADNTELYVGDSSFAPSGGAYISNNESLGLPMSIADLTGLPNTAIGGYFFPSVVTPASGAVDVTAYDIDGSTLTVSLTCQDNVNTCFAGFVSSDGISHVDFTTSSLSTNPFVGADDITFANGPSVPEPATLTLVGLGLAAIGYQRKKRLAA